MVFFFFLLAVAVREIKLLFFTFFVQMKSFYVFLSQTRSSEPGLPNLVSLDVIIDALQSFETFEELINLVGVMKVGEVFPFDVIAL